MQREGRLALANVSRWLDHQAYEQTGCGLDSQSRFTSSPGQGTCGRQLISVSLTTLFLSLLSPSVPLSFPSTLSKKIKGRLEFQAEGTECIKAGAQGE